MYLDYSKNRITDETLSLLFELARQCGLEERRTAMFEGEKINTSEQRAVLHTALAAPLQARIYLDSRNIVDDVYAVLDEMAVFANQIRGGSKKGYPGKPIKYIFNIGIEGLNLVP